MQPCHAKTESTKPIEFDLPIDTSSKIPVSEADLALHPSVNLSGDNLIAILRDPSRWAETWELWVYD